VCWPEPVDRELKRKVKFQKLELKLKSEFQIHKVRSVLINYPASSSASESDYHYMDSEEKCKQMSLMLL